MNLKLKRLVRTPQSEQYALFDLDQPDAHGSPRTIGKLDLHYTAEGMYGTLLLWDPSVHTLRPRTRRAFVHALLREIAQPMGVPNEYVVEFFAPTLDQYEVFHNVEIDEGEEPGVDLESMLAADDEPEFETLVDDEEAHGDESETDEGSATVSPLMSEPPPVRRFAPRSPDEG